MSKDFGKNIVSRLAGLGGCVCLLLVFTMAMPSAEVLGQSRKRYNPDTLQISDIQRAVKRGVERLYHDPDLQPTYTFRGDEDYRYYDQEIVHEMGNHALTMWAMLATGETYQKPELYRRLNWVLSKDEGFAYDRGMRAQMLAELPFDRWAPWVNRERIWLSSALTTGDIRNRPAEQGNFNYKFASQQAPTGFGDHANGQYGVLGLWGVQRAGLAVDKGIWERIDAHWRASQQQAPKGQPAGWALGQLDGKNNRAAMAERISGPMTAGGVSTLTLTERYLHGGRMLEPGNHISAHLTNGLLWLDKNFTLNDPAEETDWFFYMWTIQRVGHATGWRTFNNVDWFREVTAEMLNRQQSDGTWVSSKGRLLSTGFALLYMARADDPIAISKVRFEGAWNNRPHDIWNFCDYISDEYEYATTWQVVELTQKPVSLIESPVLFLTTSDAVKFDKTQLDNLRGYLDAGGLLVTNADGDKPEANAAIRRLVKELYPNLELEDVDKEHEIYKLHQRVGMDAAMQMVHNGIRPLVVHFRRDVDRALQANEPNRSSAFKALSNLYLYATGLTPRRTRMDNNYALQSRSNPRYKLAAARVKHEGDFDPEPNALRQLKSTLANHHDIDLQYQPAGTEADKLGNAKLAFLTTAADGKLSQAQATALRQWVDQGGTLWLDAIGGSSEAVQAAQAMIGQLAPGDQPVPLALDHPMLSGQGLPGGYDNRRLQYRPYALRQMGPANTSRIQAIFIDDRPAILYSEEDITAGLAGLEHWGIFGYTVDSARAIVANSAISAARR